MSTLLGQPHTNRQAVHENVLLIAYEHGWRSLKPFAKSVLYFSDKKAPKSKAAKRQPKTEECEGCVMKIRNIFRTFMNEGPNGVSRKIKRKCIIAAKIAYSRLLPERPVKSKYGVLLAPNWSDLTFRLCTFAEYGPYLANYLADYPTPFGFLDIGANQGLYSLLAAKNPHCQRVHSFEPVKKTFDLLTKNIALNGLTETITPHPFGISNIDAQVPIYVKDGHSGVASIRGQDGSHMSETIEIKSAASIDPLLPANLPIVIKIDVEGHEAEVIASIAAASFAARVQAIFYEVDENWVSPRALEDSLRAIGFSSFEKVGEGTHYDVMAQRRPDPSPTPKP